MKAWKMIEKWACWIILTQFIVTTILHLLGLYELNNGEILSRSIFAILGVVMVLEEEYREGK
ncbi:MULTISPECIES: hypothetical protein [Enterococcus]|uniref:hypothetical protein n=1 Tax=Enterococcus TaxID=1350 RepID=UPI002DBA96B7|nr:hypothetical protein [Enterococcus innesii]MEB5950513.1 hypothetical protein [Enterococcus innesii]